MIYRYVTSVYCCLDKSSLCCKADKVKKGNKLRKVIKTITKSKKENRMEKRKSCGSIFLLKARTNQICAPAIKFKSLSFFKEKKSPEVTGIFWKLYLAYSLLLIYTNADIL